MPFSIILVTLYCFQKIKSTKFGKNLFPTYENGNMPFQNNFFLDGINCNDFTFDTEYMELNAHFGKNQSYDENISHHYIISYGPKDATGKELTVEHAQELRLGYAKNIFPDYQALVFTHKDKHNRS